jgi:uncharacterized membrane protein
VIVGGILSGLVGLLTDALQAVLDGFAAVVNGIIAAWPIGMPDLPDLPDAVVTAAGWLRWGPIGVVTDACFALFTFLVTVWVVHAVAGPVMRFMKMGGSS